MSRTVEVQVEVVDRSNKPPVWDDLDRISRAVYVKENTAVGETVTTVRARSEKKMFKKIPVFKFLLPSLIMHSDMSGVS